MDKNRASIRLELDTDIITTFVEKASDIGITIDDLVNIILRYYFDKAVKATDIVKKNHNL